MLVVLPDGNLGGISKEDGVKGVLGPDNFDESVFTAENPDSIVVEIKVGEMMLPSLRLVFGCF